MTRLLAAAIAAALLLLPVAAQAYGKGSYYAYSEGRSASYTHSADSANTAETAPRALSE